MNEMEMEAFAHEALAVSSTSVPFTAATWKNPSTGSAARKALVTVESNTVRWRADGTDPTASTGHQLAAGQSLEVWGADMNRIEFIRETSDATVRVTYFR